MLAVSGLYSNCIESDGEYPIASPHSIPYSLKPVPCPLFPIPYSLPVALEDGIRG